MHSVNCEWEKNYEVSKCLFLSKRETIAVYFMVNLGQHLGGTELMCELVVKLLMEVDIELTCFLLKQHLSVCKQMSGSEAV